MQHSTMRPFQRLPACLRFTFIVRRDHWKKQSDLPLATFGRQDSMSSVSKWSRTPCCSRCDARSASRPRHRQCPTLCIICTSVTNACFAPRRRRIASAPWDESCSDHIRTVLSATSRAISSSRASSRAAEYEHDGFMARTPLLRAQGTCARRPPFAALPMVVSRSLRVCHLYDLEQALRQAGRRRRRIASQSVHAPLGEMDSQSTSEIEAHSELLSAAGAGC